jgi:hypothetical protein
VKVSTANAKVGDESGIVSHIDVMIRHGGQVVVM